MCKKIVVDFKNILSELENKDIKICFLKNRGIFIEDSQKNLYQMELYRIGSYLNKLIKDGIKVEFEIVDDETIQNIEEWEKEIWGIQEVRDFMKRQLLIA